MSQYLGQFALLVSDYNEAVAYYTGVLDFDLIEDKPLDDKSKRWVVIAPPGSNGTGARLLLARAATDEQRSRVGDQTGGRVFLFLYTDDFMRDYERYRSRGVVFIRGPVEEPYGLVGVFEDLYGNKWDLIQPQSR